MTPAPSLRLTLPLLALTLAGCPKGFPDLSKLPRPPQNGGGGGGGPVKVPEEVLDYTPEIRFSKLEFDGLSFEGVDATFLFDVTNKTPVDLKLASFSWDLALDAQPFLDGDSQEGFDLPGDATAPLEVPVRIGFFDAFQLANTEQTGDTWTLGLTGDVGFDTPVGVIEVPYAHEGALPKLKAPQIQPTAARIDNVNLLQQRATLAFDIGVTNRGGGALGLTGFGYTLGLAGTQVANGTVDDMEGVEPGTPRTVTLPVEVAFADLGGAVVSAITQKKPMAVNLGGSVQIQTPLGAIPLQLDETIDLTPR